MQIANVGGVPMQQISQNQVDYVAPRVQAQAAGQLSQLLDRMSSSLFQQASELRQKEGLQFVANNPITPEQLEAAKRGEVSQLNLGGNFNVFDQAVRKARSLELSSQFEIEGRNELIKLLADVEAGKATSADVDAKIKVFTDGYTKTLSSVDPEASFKFRATMATHGNTVLKAAYETELKRAKSQRIAKFDMDFDNGVRLLEATVAQEPERIDQMADVFRANVLTQSLLMGDAALQKDYSTKFETALRNAKVNALTKHLSADEYVNNPTETLAKIRRGDIGKLSPVLQSMIVNDFNSVAKVTEQFMTMASNRRTAMENEKTTAKLANEGTANTLLIEYFNPQTNMARRKAIGVELANLKVLTIDQMERFLNPKVEGDAYAFADLETAVMTGRVADSAELRSLAIRSGMNGDQYAKLNVRLLSGVNRDENQAFKIMQNAAGLPDVIGARSRDDQHMFDKRRILNERFENAKRDKMAKGETFNPIALAYQVIDDYNKVDGANVKKKEATQKIDRTVQDIRAKKKLPEGFTIDANTNLDDLLQRKIIDADQLDFLKKQQRILREVTQ